MSRLSESMHPAYHLRPNKAIDRFVFLEIIRTLELRCTLRNYKYIGLGGPYLEDFRLLSQQFPKMHLICVEKDEETHKRQKFHLCSRQMTCIHRGLGDYIATNFPSADPVVVWADYTDMDRECISEVADIARKAVPGSLLRVTVRAESTVYRKLQISIHKYPKCVPPKKAAEFNLIKKYYSTDIATDGASFPIDWFDWKEFSLDNYPRLLARILSSTIECACTRPKTFLPIHAVKYSDGTIMLSLTGMICLDSDCKSLSEHFREHCTFYTSRIDELDVIDVPNLTTKERLHLEAILPTKRFSGDESVSHLGYLIEGDNSEDKSRLKMQQFEKYYRLYPYFGKILP